MIFPYEFHMYVVSLFKYFNQGLVHEWNFYLDISNTLENHLLREYCCNNKLY